MAISRRIAAWRGDGARRRSPGRAKPGDHLAQFLPRGDVADADLAELLQVEQGQPLGEQLAIDDALAAGPG